MSLKQCTGAMVCAVVLLSGCAALSGGEGGTVHPQRYTLPQHAASAGAGGTRFPVVLRVATISAPDWLKTSRMSYRLNYEGSGRIAAYSRSQWANPPAAMIARNLKRYLAQSGVFRAVVANSSATAPLELDIDLYDFSQWFAEPGKSAGVLSARVTLIDSQDDNVLAQREFRSRKPAPTADAGGGVDALGRAATSFDKTVLQWIEHTLSRCQPACLATSGG